MPTWIPMPPASPLAPPASPAAPPPAAPAPAAVPGSPLAAPLPEAEASGSMSICVEARGAAAGAASGACAAPAGHAPAVAAPPALAAGAPPVLVAPPPVLRCGAALASVTCKADVPQAGGCRHACGSRVATQKPCGRALRRACHICAATAAQILHRRHCGYNFHQLQ